MKGYTVVTGGKIKKRGEWVLGFYREVRNHEKKKYFFLFALCLSPNVFKFYFQGD